VLYEMATGQQTFQGSTSAVVFDAILNREPPAPVELNANVPLSLERLIARAIDKDRTRRFQSAAEMRGALEEVRRQRDSASHSRPVAVASGSPRQRLRLAVRGSGRRPPRSPRRRRRQRRRRNPPYPAAARRDVHASPGVRGGSRRRGRRKLHRVPGRLGAAIRGGHTRRLRPRRHRRPRWPTR
jgi:serine/threonine protein kinase